MKIEQHMFAFHMSFTRNDPSPVFKCIFYCPLSDCNLGVNYCQGFFLSFKSWFGTSDISLHMHSRAIKSARS